MDRDRDVLVAIHAHEIGYIPPPYRCKPEADMPPKSDPTWVEESPPETIPAMRTSGELCILPRIRPRPTMPCPSLSCTYTSLCYTFISHLPPPVSHSCLPSPFLQLLSRPYISTPSLCPNPTAPHPPPHTPLPLPPRPHPLSHVTPLLLPGLALGRMSLLTMPLHSKFPIDERVHTRHRHVHNSSALAAVALALHCAART